jgi:hypothetical protein
MIIADKIIMLRKKNDWSQELLAQNNSNIVGVAINDHEKYEGHAFFASVIKLAGAIFLLNRMNSYIEKCIYQYLNETKKYFMRHY